LSIAFRHQGVPYYSQWADPVFARRIVEHHDDPCLDPSWRSSGFEDADHYRFWARRICGLACLKSILGHWQLCQQTHRDLLDGALRSGSYVVESEGRVNGLLYAPFATWLADAFDLQVEVYPLNPLEDLTAEISNDTMAIASVSSEIRYPLNESTRRGGHLVLVHGCDKSGVWIHNPSGATGTQADAYLSREDFSRFFANRGMVVRRGSASNRPADSECSTHT
jgi:hypothetical protein